MFAALLTSSISVSGCGSSSKSGTGSLEIDPSDATIAVNATQAFTVQLVVNGKKTDVTKQAKWTSMDTSVATIDEDGVATGVADGMTTIVGSRQGLTVSAKLTVSNASLVSIEVAPNKPTIAAGTTQQFTATGTFSDGASRDVSHDATIAWKSGSTDIATVNSSGLATAVKSGNADISAT
ncbi:MAG TPA: Ig-like domain-containing protein, partial [Polyangiales bacterium]